MLRAIPVPVLAVAVAVVAGCAAPENEETGTSESAQTQQEIAAFYEGWEARRADVVAEITARFGAPLEAMNDAQYAAFLGSIDLATDDGLMRWAAAAGMHVVALTRDSDFFYYNVHLLPESVGASLTYSVYFQFTQRFDPATGQIEMKDGEGRPLQVRTLLPDAVRRTERRGSLVFNAGYAEDRLHYPTLSGYLAPLSAIPNRADIADALRSMPLFMVKTLRGKGLFLSTQRGRSYAVTMPVSNDVYELFAGLVPGAFFEVNTPAQSRLTLVHELCHVLDNTVLKDRYGTVLYPYRYPALAALEGERDAIFEPRPADTSYGYISSYAKTNDQEDFAEHCTAWVRQRSAFETRAQQELAQGHDLLERKRAFMEKLFASSPDFVRLSDEVLAELAPPTGGDDGGSDGGGGATTPTGCGGDPACQEAACLADLRDVANISAVVSATLEVPASCETTSAPRKIHKRDGTDHYYLADMRCTLASMPTEAKQRTFTDDMRSQGFHGYSLVRAGADLVVKAQTTTRYCSSY